jgi:hypothetical protein
MCIEPMILMIKVLKWKNIYSGAEENQGYSLMIFFAGMKVFAYFCTPLRHTFFT